jgi:SOS-response transcriptional repressor LexA
MSTPYARLQQARLNAGFKEAKEAANAHGWNYQTYKSHESGGRRFRLETALEYARAFDVTAGWLLTGEGDIPAADSDAARVTTKRVPLMELTSIDSLVAISKGNKPKSDKVITIDASSDISPRAFAIEIGGNSMVAGDAISFSPGDTVVIDPDRSLEPGCFVLAVVGGEAMLRAFKRIQRGSDAAFELVPLNSFYETIRTSTDDGSVIVGRAIRHIRKL